MLDATEVWIDSGFPFREEAEKRVAIGDYVTFELRVNELGYRRIRAPGLGNKAGLWVALETMRRCAGKRLDVGLYVVSAVQEELGARGALTATTKIAPDVGTSERVGHPSPPHILAISVLSSRRHRTCRRRLGRLPSTRRDPIRPVPKETLGMRSGKRAGGRIRDGSIEVDTPQRR